MKNLTGFALFLAATLATAGSASAQVYQEKATVPFSFAVGNQTVPAGTYTIKSEGTSSDFLVITSWDKGVRLVTLGRPGEDNPNQTDQLVFDKIGDKYYLRDIRSSYSAMNIHFTISQSEKKAHAQAQEAGLKLNDPVLVALN